MKSNKWKKTVAVTLVAGSLLYVTPSYAEPNSPSLTTQVQQLESQVQILDNKIIESMEKVKQLNESIQSQEKNIASLQRDVDQAQLEFDAHKEIYFERLKVIQQEGSPYAIYAEILLNSKGFSDFLNRTTAIATFVQSDQALLIQMDDKEKELSKQNLLSIKADPM